MAAFVFTPARLRYLPSDRVEGPLPCDHVDILNHDNQSIGALDGVIVDLSTDRLRYLVVDSRLRPGHDRFLLPFNAIEVDLEQRALRVDIDPASLARCEPFDPRAFKALS